MTPPKETSEIISAVFHGLREYKERRPEGFTRWEIATLLTEIASPMKDAAVGVQNVHRELLTMDDSQKEALLQQIGDELIAAGSTHRTTDISLSILNWILDGARVFDFIMNAPPVALPADQPAQEYP